jgi:Leucine-rich repeat (LRR) protein
LSIGNQDFWEFPEDIWQIYSLQKLIISQNKPISFENAYLNNLKNLEGLILDWMYINSFSYEGCWFQLPKLKKLSLDRNTFTRFPGEAFQYMPQLEELNLWFNSISSLNKQDLKHLPNLKEINLEYNNFTEFPEALISGVCKNLKSIKFWQTALKSDSLRRELRRLCAEKNIQLHM